VFTEAQDGGSFGFFEKSVRQNFIAKVMTIVGSMLAVTFSCVGLVKISCPTQEEFFEMIQTNVLFSPAILFTVYAVSIVLLFGAICCCQSMLRKVPHNFIWLGLWTSCQTYLVTYVSGLYNADVVLQAGITTVVITASVIAVVKFTKYDFSELLPIMIVILWSVFFIGILNALIFRSSWMHFAYAVVMVIIFTVFLAIDLKMIMGGGKYELDADDYVMGAICIYMDIINIFLYLLQIFGRSD